MQTTAELIFRLSGRVGVSGMEDAGALAECRACLEPLGPCSVTPLGSLICRVKEAGAHKPHLLLTAHLDEIGLVVSYIDDKGFLRVGGCGGVDRACLWAAQVVVHTGKGDLPGVVTTIPPHLNPDDSKLPKIEEISVDIGMDGEKAKAAVSPGDRVTISFTPELLLNNLVCTKAADDRAGCAAVILAARALAAEPLDCSLTVLLASMEEVGGQGARTGAAQLAPTHAVAVDVSFAHTPDSTRAQCGEQDKGAMIGVAPILDNKMFERMKKVADREKIPWQAEVMGGATGTDADGVAVAGAGVRTALLSIPLKYMHTPVEVVSAADVDAVANLITAYAKDEFGGGH